jgi:hypothetical protein
VKKLLFISYSNDDFDKVELIEKELHDNKFFEPLVVARKRKANKALVAKVTEGIESSFCVIPILTRKSIKTQWINQEIGFAYGKGIPVIPIIQKSIIDVLKGFIHKNNDLPYSFLSKTPRGSVSNENKDFMKNFRILIKDLEKDINPLKPLGNPIVKKASIIFKSSTKLPRVQISEERKPIGTIAMSGDPCPETGLWQAQDISFRIDTFKKGEILPYNGFRFNSWKLMKYI